MDASFIKWQRGLDQLTRKYKREALKTSGATVLARLQNDSQFIYNFGLGNSKPYRELKKSLKNIDQMKADNKIRAVIRAQKIESLDMGTGRADKIRNRRNVARQIQIMLADQNTHTGLTSTLDISDGTAITQQSVSRILPDLEELGHYQVIRDGKKALRIISLIPVTSREVKEFKRTQSFLTVLEEQRAKLPEPNQAIIESNMIARERWADRSNRWAENRNAEMEVIKAAQEIIKTEEGRVSLEMTSLDELVGAVGPELAFEMADIAAEVIAEQPVKELVVVCQSGVPVSINGRNTSKEDLVMTYPTNQVSMYRSQPTCERCFDSGYVPDWANGLSAEFGEPGKKPCPVCSPPKKIACPRPKDFRHLGDGAYAAYMRACELWRQQNPGKSMITGKELK